MKKGETSRIIIQSPYAFGADGNAAFGIPQNATVEYTVTLKTFEKVSFKCTSLILKTLIFLLNQSKESWALDSEERIEQSRLFKEKGTTYFKAGKFNLAVKMYKKVLSFLEFEKGKSLF